MHSKNETPLIWVERVAGSPSRPRGSPSHVSPTLQSSGLNPGLGSGSAVLFVPKFPSTKEFRVGISPSMQTILLLIASNFFMNYAWYGHLKHFEHRPWLVAALISWGVALFEYLLQVPANRIGAQEAHMNFGQLKILQEVISLSVFIPFSYLVLKESLKLDYFFAALCMAGAVFFVFRGGINVSGQ
jgi:uncharacterized protein (DUF486 family)